PAPSVEMLSANRASLRPAPRLRLLVAATVIQLAEVRRARAVQGGAAHVAKDGARVLKGGARAEYFFDLACPFSYLAAERVERTFTVVQWRPASGAALERRAASVMPEADIVRSAAERRARELRMPLQWPDRHPV